MLLKDHIRLATGCTSEIYNLKFVQDRESTFLYTNIKSLSSLTVCQVQK